MSKVKVLAVGDPAVYAYTDERFQVLSGWDDKVQFDIVPWEKYYDTMLEVFDGKKSYDIVMVAGHLWLKDFVEKGYLTDLDTELCDDYDYNDILPVIRNELEIDGKRYLYPSFCDGHILLYRKSVLRELIDKELEEAISTDEIIKIASLCDGYRGMKGIALKAHESEIFLDFLPYLRNEGIDAFYEDTHECTLEREEWSRALKKYKELKKFAPEDTNTYGNDGVKEAFQNKKVAMTVTWGGQLGSVLTNECENINDVGFSALKTSWNVTWSFAITKNSDKKYEAEKFLQYLTSKKVDRIVGAYAGSPVRKSTYISDNEKYGWYDIHLKLIQSYAKPLPSMLNAGEKTGKLYKYISDNFNLKEE